MKMNPAFAEQIERIKLVTGTQTQSELAKALGVRQSSVADAKRRSSIPPGWLVTLMREHNANPDWILTGTGVCYLSGSEDPGADRKGGDNERRMFEEVLRHMPSRMLAEELLRRVAAAESRAFCFGLYEEERGE